MKIERRHITTEFRVSDPDQPTTIQGYAAVFNSPASNGLWTETLDPHCFDKVLASNPDVRGLWNHNPDHVLGRTTSGTLTLNVDVRGLNYSIDPPDTQCARDLVVSMRRKDVTGSSFGFICARDQWTDNTDGTITRTILEIEELLDVSPVTYPFYEAANSTVRSLPDSMPVEMRSRLEQPNADIAVMPVTLEVDKGWFLNTELLIRIAEAV
jgi:HK97 family phage prohead protease